MESSADHIFDTFFLFKKETLLKCNSEYPHQATNTIYNTYHSCNPSSLRGEKIIKWGGIVEFYKNVSELNPFTHSSDP